MSTKEKLSKHRYPYARVSSSVSQNRIAAGNDISQQAGMVPVATARNSKYLEQSGVSRLPNSTGHSSNTYLQGQYVVNNDSVSERSQNSSQVGKWNNWKLCSLCSVSFKKAGEYIEHLHTRHCMRQKDLFICRYGDRGVCSSSPASGVSEKDYDCHVAKDHAVVNMEGKINHNVHLGPILYFTDSDSNKSRVWN